MLLSLTLALHCLVLSCRKHGASNNMSSMYDDTLLKLSVDLSRSDFERTTCACSLVGDKFVDCVAHAIEFHFKTCVFQTATRS